MSDKNNNGNQNQDSGKSESSRPTIPTTGQSVKNSYHKPATPTQKNDA